MTNIVEVRDISKKYMIFQHKRMLTKNFLGDFLKRKYMTINALKDISFSVEKGEILGIIGKNSSGKSTLLKILSQITSPTEGSVTVKGKVVSLLDLGTGFHYELTGQENIYLNALLLGFTKKEIDEKIKDIIYFSELERFMDLPLKTYSSGMLLRLGFSVAAHASFDVLLIDEVITVGDEFFQKKCLDKIISFKESKKTVILVSHGLSKVCDLCDRVILLENGRISKVGKPQDIVDIYRKVDSESQPKYEISNKDTSFTFDNGKILIRYKNIDITADSGFNIFLQLKDSAYDSSLAYWDLEKLSDKHLVAKGQIYSLGMTQTWRIKMIDEDKINIKIEISTDKPLEIEDASTQIMLNSQYTRWFTESEEGSFPPILKKHKRWYTLLGWNLQRKFIGVDSNGLIPSLVFEQDDNKDLAYVQIFNSDFSHNYRLLQFKKYKQKFITSDSDYKFYFSGSIKIKI